MTSKADKNDKLAQSTKYSKQQEGTNLGDGSHHVADGLLTVNVVHHKLLAEVAEELPGIGLKILCNHDQLRHSHYYYNYMYIINRFGGVAPS